MRTYSRIGLRLDGWTVVGHCPKCGAPIWASGDDLSDTTKKTPPDVKFSCLCVDQDGLKRNREDNARLRLQFPPIP